MISPKVRNVLVLFHLLAAGLLAPLFILVAVTGGLYLSDVKGETVEMPLTIPAEITIDQEAEDVEAQVGAVLEANGIGQGFEYLRMRPGSITTRPTSREYVVLTENDDAVWSAALHRPNLNYRLMELHKGHGPQLFRIYQIVAAVMLCLVVFGGLAVGFLAKGYRRKTIGSLSAGVVIFVALGFLF